MEIPKHLTGLGKEPIREQNGWNFHYLAGWGGTVDDPNNQFARKYASRDNMFPEERKGKLDIFKLQQHGLMKDRIENGDEFFFYQLLLPIAPDSREAQRYQTEPEKKLTYYNNVMRYRNVYISDVNEGEGNQITPVTLPEAVQFNGILFMHGVCKGASENIKSTRWNAKDLSFIEEIGNTMTCTRWHGI